MSESKSSSVNHIAFTADASYQAGLLAHLLKGHGPSNQLPALSQLLDEPLSVMEAVLAGRHYLSDEKASRLSQLALWSLL